MQRYIDSQYVCDRCGRIQPIRVGFLRLTDGLVTVAPCYEWTGQQWAESGCPSEVALGAWMIERSPGLDWVRS